jgi:anti-anti-sigma regulatory factor
LDRDPALSVIVLDMAAASGLDTAGVETLVLAYRICAHVGVRLSVCNPSPVVARQLDVGVADRLAEAGRQYPRRVG